MSEDFAECLAARSRYRGRTPGFSASLAIVRTDLRLVSAAALEAWAAVRIERLPERMHRELLHSELLLLQKRSDRAMKWLTPLGRIGGRIAFWLLQIPLVTPTHRVATAYSKGKRCSWRSRATRRCRGR